MFTSLGKIWDWIYYLKDGSPTPERIYDGKVEPRVHGTILITFASVFLFGLSHTAFTHLAAFAVWLVFLHGFGDLYNLQVRLVLYKIRISKVAIKKGLDELHAIERDLNSSPNPERKEYKLRRQQFLIATDSALRADLKDARDMGLQFAILFLTRMGVLMALFTTHEGHYYAHCFSKGLLFPFVFVYKMFITHTMVCGLISVPIVIFGSFLLPLLLLSERTQIDNATS